MYLISVYFDDNANRILQNLINKIANVSGNNFMILHQVPPHMTISSIEARSVDVLIPAFESLRDMISQGEIQFVSVGQLLPYVMYSTPVLNEYLQRISGIVYGAINDIEDISVSRFYKPGSWLPHVTLGKTLSEEQMIMAFEILQKSFSPFSAKIVEIGLAKVNPHEDVIRFKLKSG